MGPVFKANIVLQGKIEAITGLHIGGSKDKLEIGGVDSPVLRDPFTKLPYLPGSSLKGKMRALLEYALGKVPSNGDVSEDEEIVGIFGIGAKEKHEEVVVAGPTRLIVRDCYPDEKTKEMWKNLDSELLYTEYKPENGINRITSAANPRFLERVVAGSYFDFEMIFSVFQTEESFSREAINKDLANLMMCLRMLEHSAIGKSGSRGYGKIKFHVKEPVIVRKEDYQEDSPAYLKTTNPSDDLKPLSEISLTYTD